MGAVVRPQNDCHLIHVRYKNEPIRILSLKEQVQRSGNGQRKRAPHTGRISTLRQKPPDGKVVIRLVHITLGLQVEDTE
jgi:hypothetical protein